MVREALLALLSLGTLVSSAPAQDSIRVADVGTRVRLSFPGRSKSPVVGVLWNIGADSLIVMAEGQKQITLPRSQVSRVQISLERKHNYARGAGIGAALGAGIAGLGLVIGTLALDPCDGVSRDQLGWCWDASASNSIRVLAMAALTGAGAGIAHSKPRDRWVAGRLEGDAIRQESHEPRLFLDLAGSRGTRLGFRMVF